jgi:crotonobetainyl-CoA:carnitine CoA-transferase CaiB-like acyl-CoA transferase
VSADLGHGPLQGLKVLELGQLLAGSYVGTLLIKIEPPLKGDANPEFDAWMAAESRG